MRSTITWLVIIINFMILSCSKETTTSQRSSDCGSQPPKGAILDGKNVQAVNFDEDSIVKSGNVSLDKLVGYRFNGHKGQKLSYKVNNDVCVWVYTPDNDLLTGTELPKNGEYIIQVSALKQPTTFNLEVTSTAYLSQEYAVNLVKKYFLAKKTIFASPFDEKLGSELLSGKLYSDKISGTESSIKWLKKYNSYYRYDRQTVDQVKDFKAISDREGSIDLMVSEGRTLCQKNDKPTIGENTVYDKTLIRYFLQLDGNRWKISNIQSLTQINSRSNSMASCKG
jgi:ARC6-like, IMS domain